MLLLLASDVDLGHRGWHSIVVGEEGVLLVQQLGRPCLGVLTAGLALGSGRGLRRGGRRLPLRAWRPVNLAQDVVAAAGGVVVFHHAPSEPGEGSAVLAAVGQVADRAAALGSFDVLGAGLRVPARVAGGDGALPVPAGPAMGALVFLDAVQVPDTGSRRRLQVGDEVLGGGGAHVDVVDEVDGGAGAEAVQEGDGRVVAGVLGSHRSRAASRRDEEGAIGSWMKVRRFLVLGEIEEGMIGS
ncbi:hypothetical protein SEVIR_9G025150v4 [Setaria viridis]